MLIQGYEVEIFRPVCNPEFQSVHCLARLDGDAGQAIPYLNAELGGDDICLDPPSVTLRNRGRLITVHAREIAINALADEAEARKILDWLVGEINRVWEERDSITPEFSPPPKPVVLEILKLLPRTNCGECGRPTCLVFASLAKEGILGAENCPELDGPGRAALAGYLDRFSF